MLELIQPKKKSEYCEIGQNRQIKFACVNILDGKAQMLHAPFLCRDFLSDVLHAEATGTKQGIYGFYFDGSKDKWDTDTNLLMTYKEIGTIVAHLELLHQCEDMMGIRRTIFYKTQHKDKIIISGAPEWRKSTLLLSLYTLLLRYLAYADPELEMLNLIEKIASGQYGNDTKYAKTILNGTDLLFFFKNWREIHENTNHIGREGEVSIDIIHNCGGIVTFSDLNGYITPTQWRQNYNKLISMKVAA